MEGNEPGPSSQRVRRPRKISSKEIAAIYARLSDVEGHAGAMEKATTIRFDELSHDVARLQSNSETQKKVLAQELARIEEQTESAVQRTQTQIDSLRQQTTDMHSSLTAIHTHSATLTDSLKMMMQNFQDLRFDLPNTFEEWMTMREARKNGTVSSAELQHEAWNPGSLPSLPSVPPLLPLHVTLPPPAPLSPPNSVAPAPNAGSTESPPDAIAANPASAPTSSNDLYTGFMGSYMPEPSDAMRDLNHKLDNSAAGDTDMDRDNVDLADRAAAPGIEQEDQEAVTVPLGRISIPGDDVVVEQEMGGEIERTALGDGMDGTAQGLGGAMDPAAQELGSEMDRPAPMERVATPDGAAPGTPSAAKSPVGEPRAMRTDDSPLHTQEVTSGRLPDVPPVANSSSSQTGTPGQSQQTPPSTPPTFIRDNTVPPPPGMLVNNDIQVFPPSSQSSMPSPSPQPNFRLLNRPRTGHEAGSTGPVTRSRSRSISPSVPAAESVPPPPPVRRKSSRKPASGK